MEKPKSIGRSGASGSPSLSVLKQQIRVALRKVFTRYHEPRKAVLAEARRVRPRTKKSGGESLVPDVYYICNDCGHEYKAFELAVDHIQPVGTTPEYPATNVGDWERWMDKLFCSEDNLQVLCTNCHARKTREERRVPKVRQKRAQATRRSS